MTLLRISPDIKKYSYEGYAEYRESFNTLEDLFEDMKKEIAQSKERLNKLGLPDRSELLHFVLLNSETKFLNGTFLNEKMSTHEIENLLKYAKDIESLEVLLTYDIPAASLSEEILAAPKEWLDNLFTRNDRVRKVWETERDFIH